jgi:hypothetical protein
MTSRTYSTLDPNATHSSLVLSEGNRVVTTRTTGLDFHRCAHGTIPKAVGSWYFGGYFSSVARTSLAGKIAFGVAQPNSALNKYVGEDALAYGLLPADGVVRSNGSDVVTGIPLIAERRFISIYVYPPSGGQYRAAWYVDGNQVATVLLPSGKFWVPAVTVSGGNAGEIRAEFNFGTDVFDAMPIATIT